MCNTLHKTNHVHVHVHSESTVSPGFDLFEYLRCSRDPYYQVNTAVLLLVLLLDLVPRGSTTSSTAVGPS